MRLYQKTLAFLVCLAGVFMLSGFAFAAPGTVKVIGSKVTDLDSANKKVVLTLNNSQISSATLEYSIGGEIYSTKSEKIENNKAEFKVDCSVAGNYELELLIANLENGATEHVVLNEPGFNISFGESKEKVILASGAVAQRLNAPKNAAGKTVIVLDPGHDSIHTGAQRGGVGEETLNFKIAQAAYNELKTYADVEVYLTRSSAACPIGGGALSDCLLHRANFAKSKGAHLFVSFHNNSTGAQSQTSASGAMVYISNHSRYLYGSSPKLSNSILSNLKSSFPNIKTHGARTNADDAGVGNYDDGRHMDDLSVLRNCVLANIEPALIEHLYMNNPNDMAILKVDANLTKMGIADAKGIAQYLGLSKRAWSINNVNYSVVGSGSNLSVNISASVSGTIKDPKYKFVYCKLNPLTGKYDWKTWGVIKDFSSSNSVTWSNVPSEGKYMIYVDVKDGNGVTATKTSAEFGIVPQIDFSGINVSGSKEQGKAMTIAPKITGNTSGYTYKYVWDAGSWATGKWGVIKDFSTSTSVSFVPTFSGKNDLYVDVKSPNGTIVTKKVSVTVSKTDIKYTGIDVDYSNFKTKNTLTIKPVVNNPISGLKYKFVWGKDGWKEWGVFQALSTKNTAPYKCSVTGPVNIYVDIQKPDGEIITKNIRLNLTGYTSVSAPSSANVGDTVTIEPNISNPHGLALKYKYVWRYNGTWNEWGVIKAANESDFTTKTSKTFTLKKPGKYEFYIDVQTPYGVIETKQAATTSKLNWNITSIPAKVNVGDTVTISPKVTNATNLGMKYKYVWRYNGTWNEWGVIKAANEDDFTAKTSRTFQVKKPGKYEFYVDIKNSNGIAQTKTVSTNAVLDWEVKASPASVKVGDTVTIEPKISNPNNLGLEYKYVWRYNGTWNEWGVIKSAGENDFTTKTSRAFKIKKAGKYDFYVDIRNKNGIARTKTVSINAKAK